MPDLRGNGPDSELEYRSLPLPPRGTGPRSVVWPTVLLFLLVLLEVISQCHVLASSCSSLAYYFDYMPTPPVAIECLKLTSDLSVRICNKQVSARQGMIRKHNIRLHFCSSYPIYSLISASDKDNQCRIDASMADCTSCLDRLLSVDQQIAYSIEGFQDLLDRMDCVSRNSRYSVKWNCTHCKIAYKERLCLAPNSEQSFRDVTIYSLPPIAYKEWLCATKLSYYHERMDHPVPPCEDFCSRVEEMCPFFPPENDDTHAGDPSFICKDPEIASQSSVYGQKPGCYKLCHLVENVEEVFHSEDCHQIDLTSNKNVTVSNGTVASSSTSAQYQRYCIQNVILQLLCVWVTRTVLQHTSIGLT